jgi:hypothetical protein
MLQGSVVLKASAPQAVENQTGEFTTVIPRTAAKTILLPTKQTSVGVVTPLRLPNRFVAAIHVFGFHIERNVKVDQLILFAFRGGGKDEYRGIGRSIPGCIGDLRVRRLD